MDLDPQQSDTENHARRPFSMLRRYCLIRWVLHVLSNKLCLYPQPLESSCLYTSDPLLNGIFMGTQRRKARQCLTLTCLLLGQTRCNPLVYRNACSSIPMLWSCVAVSGTLSQIYGRQQCGFSQLSEFRSRSDAFFLGSAHIHPVATHIQWYRSI